MKKIKLITLALLFIFIGTFNIFVYAVDFNSPLTVGNPPLNEFQIDNYKKIMWNLNNSTNVKYIAIYNVKSKVLYISNNFTFYRSSDQVNGEGGGDIYFYFVRAKDYYSVTTQTVKHNVVSSGSGTNIGRLVELYVDGTASQSVIEKELIPTIVMANSQEQDLRLDGFIGSAIGTVHLPKVDKWHFIQKPDSDPNDPTPTIDPSQKPKPNPTIEPLPSAPTVGGIGGTTNNINDVTISSRPFIKPLTSVSETNTGGWVGDVVISPEKFATNKTNCNKDANGNYTCSSTNQNWVIDWPNFPNQNVLIQNYFESGVEFNFDKYISGNLEFDFGCGGINGTKHYSIPLKDSTNYIFTFEEPIHGELIVGKDWTQKNYPYVQNVTITNLIASDGITVQDNQLNDTLINGDSNSQNVENSLNDKNTALDSTLGNFESLDNKYSSELDNALKDINFNNFKLDNAFLASSSKFVANQFNSLTNNNPIGLVLGFSLIVGLGLLLIGKRF